MTRHLITTLLLVAGCATSVGPSGRGDPDGPFDREELVLCDPLTGGLGVRTVRGGYMSVQLVGTCTGTATCELPDQLAPGAWTTIRVAGREIIVGSCVIDALGGTDLAVTFSSGMGEAEVYEIPLVGACLSPGTAGCTRDSGMPPPMDAGTPLDGST